MVNINLLEKEKLKRKRQRSFFSPPQKSNSRFLIYAVMVLTVFLAWFFNWEAKDKLAAAASQRAELQEQSAQLATIQAEAEKYEKIKSQSMDRIHAIEELRKDQRDPLQLMNTLVDSIASDSHIWLTKLSKEGSNVTIQGRALAVPAIADLMDNLESNPPFSKVEINYWEVQDNSIEFDLNCEILETMEETASGKSEVE